MDEKVSRDERYRLEALFHRTILALNLPPSMMETSRRVVWDALLEAATKGKSMITTLVPWYGSNRMLAENVGKHLAGCEWVGVPFAGGMCELNYIKARTVVVSDVHRLVINLARVAKDDELRKALIEVADDTLFHPDELDAAQENCRLFEACGIGLARGSLEAAIAFFVSSWMARSGAAGAKNEFTSGIATRWNAGGGDSAVRFRNATKALEEFGKVARRCTFVTDDFFDFVGQVHDKPKHGLYCDPPFPGPGDKYKHTFTIAKHELMAKRLTEFQQCRVVCRFYDVKEIRDLYLESAGWKWHRYEGRTQANKESPEVLLVRN